MCAATIYWANIGRVVHGASNEALDQLAGENENLTWTCPKDVKKDVQVIGPTDLVIEEAIQLSRSYWKSEGKDHHRIDDGDDGLIVFDFMHHYHCPHRMVILQ